MSHRNQLKLSRDEVAQSFAAGNWAAKFPPILSVDQAAEILQVPKATVYLWHSQRRLTRCAQRLGKHLRFFRDRLILQLLNEGV